MERRRKIPAPIQVLKSKMHRVRVLSNGRLYVITPKKVSVVVTSPKSIMESVHLINSLNLVSPSMKVETADLTQMRLI